MSQSTFSIEIPSEFYSSETHAPLDHCIACGRYLLENDIGYFVEKAIKRYPEYKSDQVIFEYAVCSECHQAMSATYSTESTQAIQNYFAENTDIMGRFNLMQEMTGSGMFELKDWLSNCLIKGTPVENLHEYQIACQCIGDRMVVGGAPFLISNQAMDEMMLLLSDKTIDQLNRYMDEFFGLPPELRKLLADSGVLIF